MAEDITIAAAVDLGNLAGKATGSVPHPTLKDANGKPVRIANGVPDPDQSGFVLPAGVKQVRLLGDYDSEIFATAARMAVAVRRLIDMGVEVHIHFPPTPDLDWNDQLLKGEDGAPEEPEQPPATASYAEKAAGFGIRDAYGDGARSTWTASLFCSSGRQSRHRRKARK